MVLWDLAILVVLVHLDRQLDLGHLVVRLDLDLVMFQVLHNLDTKFHRQIEMVFSKTLSYHHHQHIPAF
jgi:hypothetical protein